MIELLFDSLPSPLGTLLVVVDDARLCAVDYAGYEPRMMQLLKRHYGAVQLKAARDPGGLSRLFHAYFAGDLTCLAQIAINPGGTSFQQQVWSALRRIPPGTVMTYGQLAVQLGRPAAARAVGMANALNPIAIVIPCHRLVGSTGALTGYAGGLERKRRLLEHEGVSLR